MTATVSTRKCMGKCKRVLPLTMEHFYKRKGSREDAGFSARCKVCLRAQGQAQRKLGPKKKRVRARLAEVARLSMPSREEIARLALQLPPFPWELREMRAAEQE